MRRAVLCLCFLLPCLGLANRASAQLLANYKCEEVSSTRLYDSSGKGNHGLFVKPNLTLTTGEPNWVPGILGQALKFDGNLSVQLPADRMGLRSDAGSVTFWLYMSSMTGGINTLWWGGDNITGSGFGPENEMHIHVEAFAAGIWTGGELGFFGLSTPNFHIFSDPNKGDVAGVPPVSPILMADSTWRHVACTWGNPDANVKLYLNGEVLDQAPQGPTNYPLSTIWLGRMAGGGRTLNGTLDDVQIYGRALTPEEVLNIKNGVLALTYAASLPSPAHRITEVLRDAVCSWTVGDTVATHNVYFGTVFEDVNAATVDDPRGTLVSRNQTTTTYDPPGLMDYNQVYYWRVDEVEADGKTIQKGSVWQFTTLNFVVVDNFESYTDDVTNRIVDFWLDGWNTTTNGAVVGYSNPDLTAGKHYAETTIVRSGVQAMPLSFNTNLKISEATLPLTGEAADWTREGVQDLSLWFRGYSALTGTFKEEPVGTYTMTSAGTDIWGTIDQFHFAYKEISGATTIVARVDSLTNTNPFAKAGIMIRDSLEPGSNNVGLFVTPANGTRFQRRMTKDGNYETTEFIFDANRPTWAPNWLKLERTAGGLCRAYHSEDGKTWTRFNVYTVIMFNPLYVGMAVTSHDLTVTTEAKISNVTVTGTGKDGVWKAQDIGVLNNSPKPIFVSINDSAAVYHADPNASKISTWTQWTIPLQQFADKGVNLKGITKMTIGIGTQGDMSSPGGSGTLFIDDIRLYRP